MLVNEQYLGCNGCIVVLVELKCHYRGFFFEKVNEHSYTVKLRGYFLSPTLLGILHGVRRYTYSILVKRAFVAAAGWRLTNLFAKLETVLLFINSYNI